MRRWLALAALPLSCLAGPRQVRPQLVVVMDTDTVVPRFGDRLLVEVLASDGKVCAGCRRVFDVGAAKSWPYSFGVEAGFHAARLRLYRKQDQLADGGSRPATTIDLLANLPSPGSGVRTVRATLRMACAGQPASVEAWASCVDGAMGAAPLLQDDDGSPSLVGTWPGAAGRPCAGSPAKDEACVPGGAYYMGDDTVDPATTGPAHLVRLSPFFLDVDEVRFEVFRDFFLSLDLAGKQSNLLASEARPGCILPQLPSTPKNLDRPVNCITPRLAKQYCESIGKRLPTEAEWEWAAQSGEQERAFVWGAVPDVRCSEVVLERSPAAYKGLGAQRCTFPLNERLPPPIASGSRDVDAFAVRDLAGGLREIVADRYASYDAPCWTGPLLEDPRCDAQTKDHAVRGSSWFDDAGLAHRARRTAMHELALDPSVGFRCARDDQGAVPPERPEPPPPNLEQVCQAEEAELWKLRDVRVSSSGVRGQGYSPGFVLDGKPTTGWQTNLAPVEPWLEIELPFAGTVSRVLAATEPGTDDTFTAATVAAYGAGGEVLATADLPGDGEVVFDPPLEGVVRVRYTGTAWVAADPNLATPMLGELHILGRCP